MNTPRPTVFIVDDDPSFLKAVTRLLQAAGYEVRTFTSAAEFLKNPPADCPGCVIADLHMPGPSGLDLQAALAATDNPLPVVFLTGQGDISTSVHAIKHGAEDFLTKPAKKDKLFAAIERALARDARERTARERLRGLRRRFEALTPREHEVVAHLLRGQLNKEVAADLGTTERTIKAHRANLMAKLQIESLAELVRLAQESGLYKEA